jgi:hypothetical protein
MYITFAELLQIVMLVRHAIIVVKILLVYNKKK